MNSDKLLRIGVDLYALSEQYSGGVKTFSLGLCQGFIDNNKLCNIELVLLVSNKNYLYISNQFMNMNIKIHIINVSLFTRIIRRLLVYLSWITREYRFIYWYDLFFRKHLTREIENLVDVLITPTTLFNLYAFKIPTILCIHDIQHEYFPENFTFHQLVLRWPVYRLSSSRATTVQVSSRFIKDCLIEKFSFLSKDKIKIIPEGVDTVKFSNNSVNNEPEFTPKLVSNNFIFYPAQLWRHKNHVLLLNALALFRKRMGFEMTCILTGHDFGYWKELKNTQSELEIKSVYYLGLVEVKHLIWLYKNCFAVLALGLHESSSLPVREGASLGKPLICSDIEPNIETSEYLRINIFKQNSCESLCDLLIKIYKNYEIFNLQAQENLFHVESLSWKSLAKQYINELRILNPLQNRLD